MFEKERTMSQKISTNYYTFSKFIQKNRTYTNQLFLNTRNFENVNLKKSKQIYIHYYDLHNFELLKNFVFIRIKVELFFFDNSQLRSVLE